MTGSDESTSRECVRLQEEYDRINEEIKNYPRPIAACDLQFNYLLERRRTIAADLSRLQEGSPQGRTESEAQN